jgi:hypothetical protein
MQAALLVSRGCSVTAADSSGDTVLSIGAAAAAAAAGGGGGGGGFSV